MSHSKFEQIVDIMKGAGVGSDDLDLIEGDLRKVLDEEVGKEDLIRQSATIPWVGCRRCRLEGEAGGLPPAHILVGGAEDVKVFFIELIPHLAVDPLPPLLKGMLESLSLSCYATSVVKCFQPRFGITTDLHLVGFCKITYLQREIEKLDPSVIVCFGEELLEILTGERGLERVRQEGLPLRFMDRPMIPTFDLFEVEGEGEGLNRWADEMRKDMEKAAELAIDPYTRSV